MLIRHYFKLKAEGGKKLAVQELPSSLLHQFQANHWPGNVRELFNELERYLIVGEVRLEGNYMSRDPVPQPLDFVFDSTPLAEAIDRFECYYIHKVLQQHRGQKMKTADVLNIVMKTPCSKLHKHAKCFTCTQPQRTWGNPPPTRLLLSFIKGLLILTTNRWGGVTLHHLVVWFTTFEELLLCFML